MVGAGLDDYIGRPNTRAVGRELTERIQSRITSIGLIKRGDLSVRVVPISIHEVLVILTIEASSSPRNRLANGVPFTVTMVYNSTENNTFFVPPEGIAKKYQ